MLYPSGTLPYPRHGEIRWKLGDFHHLGSVWELLKDPEPQGELFFGISIGFTLL